jgi:hypothetical protein
LVIRGRFNDTNGNCLDAYGEGSSYVDVNGPIAIADGVGERPFSGECFANAIPTQPVAPYHEYRIIDTSEVVDGTEPEVGLVQVGVKYRQVGGVQMDTSFSIRTCR